MGRDTIQHEQAPNTFLVEKVQSLLPVDSFVFINTVQVYEKNEYTPSKDF